MTTKMIVACIDGSELGDAVVDHAIWLANSSQSPLQFLHTIEHSHQSEHINREGNLTPNMKEHLLDELSDEERLESKKLIAEGKTILDAAKQKAQQAGLTNITAKQRHGSLPEALVDIESDASLVILGAKGENHQGDKQGLGSQLEESIRAIHTPVFIVKRDFSQPKKMLFAYNGSPTSSKALKLLAEGQLCSPSLDVHVVAVKANIDDAKKLIDEASIVLSKSKLNVSTRALQGEVIEQLTAYQQENDIDITCMGAFSHGKVHGFFFGSFTTRMLLESSTSFLLIR
jgi:nucleotide-binding universal stress UspA family protein